MPRMEGVYLMGSNGRRQTVADPRARTPRHASTNSEVGFQENGTIVRMPKWPRGRSEQE
jgi:hypothetical protein